MLTITKKLDMSPHGVPQVIRVSQYDSDFTLEFKLFASGGNFAISTGTTAEIRGTKQSGTGYSASATLDTSTKVVTVAGAAQMTAVAGMNIFEIVLKKNNKEISSANFCLLVERAALDADTITDESVLKELNAIIEGAETATQAAEEAEDAADRAEAAAQTLVIDPTLTLPGQPADAKATGDAIAEIEDEIAQIVPGLSSEAKAALLNCFSHVAWIDEHGQDYYDALYNALYDGDYVYEWSANSGVIPQGLTYSSVEWGTNNEYLKVYDGNLFLGYANNMTIEVEVAYDAPYNNSHGITVADRVNHGVRLYTKPDGTLRFVGSENGQTSGTDVVGVDSSIFHKIKIELQNGTASLYIDDAFIASRDAYSSPYLFRPVLNSSPTITGFSKRIKSIKFTRDKNAVLEDKIKVFFGKGISGSNIIDNTKRFLTEPILFDTNLPLTVQYSGCAEYNVRYAVKIVDNQGNIWVYNSSTDEYDIFWRKNDDITVQADDVYQGWIVSDSEIVSGKRVDDVQYIYEKANILNTNGSIRILFADIDSTDNTPDYNIGGTLVIQRRSYILEGRDKNEFI